MNLREWLHDIRRSDDCSSIYDPLGRADCNEQNSPPVSLSESLVARCDCEWQRPSKLIGSYNSISH